MNAFEIGQHIHGFVVDNIEEILEIQGIAYHLTHVTSSLELLHLDVPDDELGLAIGFKTRPADNTGVFHILEHSVLCGSDKYPVKKPFVHLLKSSMKTYMNALTGPDFTMFPVASTNEKDLMNLASVYLDAVFRPAILHEPRILKQEGWHYEFDGKELTVNGVVYNEMKGQLATPDIVLRNAVMAELFPDTAYRFVSGGVPGEMESLSYEQFVDTYKRHYRPDNAAVVLFGKLNVEAYLAKIDNEYLAKWNVAESSSLGNPNPRGEQKPIISTKRKVTMKALPQNASLAFASAFADARDNQRILAMQVLSSALLENPEAPLRRKLLDAGFATDFYPVTDIASKAYLQVVAQEVKPNSAQLFLEALQSSCREILDEGLDKSSIEAALFQTEFHARTGGPGEFRRLPNG